ncbi:LON peptidase substrate-binding domain-containing protein [bacterium]|nr:LON peptidase substrate-binding domain-containing protein [bacterium]
MEQTREIVPLYALTEVVFFPQTLLPLYVYEKQYQMMIEDCLRSDQRLAIGLLRNGWERDYYGNPKIFKSVCIGRIIRDEKLADGKYNIHIQGLERAQIIREIDYSPYRKIMVQSLPEFICQSERKQLLDEIKFLLALCERLLEYIPNRKETLSRVINNSTHPGIIADQIAFNFIEDKYVKQCILSEFNVLRRVKLVIIQVQNILVNLSRQYYKDSYKDPF